jgi:hypothetical protein
MEVFYSAENGGSHMTYPVLDVTLWQEDKEEYGQGEREKVWLINPENGKLAMLKFPREDRGEHWAEKLCYEFSTVLKFPRAVVDLAERSGRIGSLSHFFVDKEGGFSHYDGGKYFPSDYDRQTNKGYNFQLIRDVLNRFPEYNLIDGILQIMVFDALVGQGDRHQDNWGISRSETEDKMFISPMYDNSACLGRDQTDQKALALTESNEALLAFVNRSKSKIGWNETRNAKHFVLIDELLRQYPIQMIAYLKQLELLTNPFIRNIVFNLPQEVISNIQKEFVVRYVILRRELLLEKVM